MPADHLVSGGRPGTPCPVCAQPILILGPPPAGSVVDCPTCLVELEVVDVGPVVLAVAADTAEDRGD